jgi:hypothetical protein
MKDRLRVSRSVQHDSPRHAGTENDNPAIQRLVANGMEETSGQLIWEGGGIPAIWTLGTPVIEQGGLIRHFDDVVV